jgi:hypothetical protein
VSGIVSIVSEASETVRPCQSGPKSAHCQSGCSLLILHAELLTPQYARQQIMSRKLHCHGTQQKSQMVTQP